MSKKSVEELKKEFDRVQRLYLKYLKLREIKSAELVNACPHTDTYEKDYYFPGSYTDTAYTEYVSYCKCCGKRLSERTVNHNYYG